MPTHDLRERLVRAYRVAAIPSPEAENAIVARLLEQPSVVPHVRKTRVVSAVAIAVAIAATLLVTLRGVHSLIVTPDREPPSSLQQAPNHAPRGTACEQDTKDCVAASTASAASWFRPPSETPSEISGTVRTLPPVTRRAVSPPTNWRPGEAGTSSQAAPSAGSPSVRPDAPGETPSTLAKEAKLLAGAQAALRDGAHDRALQALDEHAATFPTGAMRLERRALRAVALCSSGRIREGKEVARRLVTPGSTVPYSARIASACGVDQSP